MLREADIDKLVEDLSDEQRALVTLTAGGSRFVAERVVRLAITLGVVAASEFLLRDPNRADLYEARRAAQNV